MSQLSRLFMTMVTVMIFTVAAACSHPQPAAKAPAPDEAAPPATPPATADVKPPAQAVPPDPYAPIDAAGKVITADVLRDQITKISSDEFEGRGPTTRGDQAARAYLVDQLKALGYEPGGAGGAWEQPFELVGIKAAMPAKWTFSHAGKSLALG